MAAPRPSNAPDWATGGNYSGALTDPDTGGIATWAGTPVRSTPSGGDVSFGFVPKSDVAAEKVNSVLGVHGDWLKYFDRIRFAGTFGTGVDGAAVFDGASAVVGSTRVGAVYTLSRDVYYTDATLSASVTLLTNGYRIFCTGTLTAPATTLIHNNGKTGNAGTATGAVAVSGGVSGALAGGAFSGAGNGHTSGAATVGFSRTDSRGGAGGGGGAGLSGAAAAGGTVTIPNSLEGGLGTLWSLQAGMVAGYNSGAPGVFSITGGAGGGGGGAGDDSFSSGSNGGGGGSGGGVIVISVFSLVLDGTITANGGTGGAATLFSGSGYGGGGGGGGGGGVVLVSYAFKSGAGTITANGGVGGNKGPNGSNDGTVGATGTVITVDLSA